MDITKQMIVSQMQERPQKSLCDSGGAYGYQGERNAAKTWDELVYGEKTEAHVYTHSDPHALDIQLSVSMASYLYNNLTFNKELDDEFQEFYNNSEECNLAAIVDFLESKGIEHTISNSYNYENSLDGVIQWAEFEYQGEKVAILSYHTGCDVRGSYSRPRTYTINCYEGYLGHCDCDSYGCKSAQWDEDKRSQTEGVDDLDKLPVLEFIYESKLEKQLEDLQQTTQDTEKNRKLMTARDVELAEEAFQEFCDYLDEPTVVVYNCKAFFVDGPPEEIYGQSFSLMG